MPRHSRRQQSIHLMELRIEKLRKEAIEREIAGDDDDSVEEDNLYYQSLVLDKMKNSRYLFRKKYRKKTKTFDMEDALSLNSINFNDEEFLSHFRITHSSFFLLLDVMKERRAFNRVSKNKKQRPVAYQLLVFLYRIGKEGTSGGSMDVSAFFGIGKGTVNNYCKRCVKGLLEMKEEVVYWPDDKERLEMRKRLSANGFRHCVGIIDGTLIELTFRPESYHECYYTRKSNYALNVMIVCDDKRRIIYYNAGWPGSTHDNRVFRNSKLFYNRKEYFSHHEYLLGDCAYSASPVMVQCFKKQASTSKLPPNNEFFNTCVAQVQITSEHCIGILKGRFRCLKRNNIKLRNSKKEVKEMVELIGACIVLHNLLINYDEDDIPDSWYDEMNEDIDWTMYDEEEEDIAHVWEEKEDRRKFVFNLVVNNFL